MVDDAMNANERERRRREIGRDIQSLGDDARGEDLQGGVDERLERGVGDVCLLDDLARTVQRVDLSGGELDLVWRRKGTRRILAARADREAEHAERGQARWTKVAHNVSRGRAGRSE